VITDTIDPLVPELAMSMRAQPIDLAGAALIIARLEYPALDPRPSLETLDRLGAQARVRVRRVSGQSVRARLTALNGLLFEDEGFSGNHGHYDDFRNSFLNIVLERRLGIPITLALVYMEVASRAGIDVQGIAFPGHFLMRVPVSEADAGSEEIFLDPFDAGVELDIADCRKLLGRHLGVTAEEGPFDPTLLRPCSRRHMLARILNNLKRTYVELRSFRHARRVTNLLLTVDPMLLSEVRDRGLLSYHLDDWPAALRDLEDYLRLRNWKDDADQDEHQQIVDHVKTLRRRVAGMN
jgi:regulator of sirC expression with transglutaminase-like and TPR domain